MNESIIERKVSHDQTFWLSIKFAWDICEFGKKHMAVFEKLNCQLCIKQSRVSKHLRDLKLERLGTLNNTTRSQGGGKMSI